MNILIKLTCLIGLVIAPLLVAGHGESNDDSKAEVKEIIIEAPAVEITEVVTELN